MIVGVARASDVLSGEAFPFAPLWFSRMSGDCDVFNQHDEGDTDAFLLKLRLMDRSVFIPG